MIEIKYLDKIYSFSSNTVGQKLKELIHINECIGFLDLDNNEIYDLHSQIQGPLFLDVITKNHSKANLMLRSSLALILADVVNEIFLNYDNFCEIISLDVDKNGLSCKFHTDIKLSEYDFPIIKQKMIEKIAANILFEKNTRSFDESKASNNSFFAAKAQEGPNEWYKFGKTEILSTMPFLMKSSDCNSFFEINKVAQEDYCGLKVQKISAIAFFEKDDFEQYFATMELIKKNDHRLIGQHLELFYFVQEAPGSAFWLPKGWKLFRNLENHIRSVGYCDYIEVHTPQVLASSFWEKSGHMKAFKQNMMHIHMGCEEIENAALKPMNCPGHIEIFKYKIRSYKDLPLRLAEFGSCHRYEPSGSLHGLLRVRAMTQDDGHIFCTKQQIKDEIKNFMQQCVSVLKNFNFTELRFVIATQPEQAFGNDEDWNYAQKALAEALQEIGILYEIAIGEGAFYGPKIEVHVLDSMQRSWQLSTIQIDFVLPERFNITYDDENGKKQRPCMLHRAILGSLERFIGILLEHTGGHLPINLSPIQVVICSVSQESAEYASTIYKFLEKNLLSAYLDIREHTLNYKIREHKIAKIPMIIVVGKKEMNAETMELEVVSKNQKYTCEYKNIVNKIQGIINEMDKNS